MFKKMKMRSFVVGFLVALLIGNFGFAETAKKTLNAVYNNIKIIIDGIEITPRDANGNRIEPFVVADTTYLPVRVIAEALGQPVEWDAEKNAVVIGTKKTESGNIGITELIKTRPKYSGEGQIGDIEAFEVLQQRQSGENAIRYGDATFLLNGDFKRLTGKFAVPDGSKNYGHLEIYADKKLIFDTKDYAKKDGIIATGHFDDILPGSKVIPIDLDLIGVEKLYMRAYSCGIFYNVGFEPLNK